MGSTHERSPCVQRDGISRTLTRAPTWANPDSIGCVFICIDLRTGPCGPHNKCGLLCRSDSNNTTWFVALTEEQLTASPCGRPSDDWFHWQLLFSSPTAARNHKRHRTRYPAGLLSSCQGIGWRCCLGSVGRTCRSFLSMVAVCHPVCEQTAASAAAWARFA